MSINVKLNKKQIQTQYMPETKLDKLKSLQLVELVKEIEWEK